MAQTLEQLKEENARLEAEASANPQEVDDEVEVEAADVEEEESQGVAEPTDDESGEAEAELEDWMKSDDDQTSSSDGEKKFTDSDISASKKKLRAKLERKHDEETEKLRQRIKELEQGGSQPDLHKPKREQFYDHEDPEEAYAEAVAEWKWNQKYAESQAAQAARDAERKRLEYQQNVAKEVEGHYERAVKLAQESGISPELYQSADLSIRQAVDEVFPGGGDSIMDSLISVVGEGSERIFYNLGINKARKAEFQSLLKADQSGLKAAAYLGALKKELTSPKKRTTNAPKPAPNAEGDASTSQTAQALKSKYDKAHKAGDTQVAFNLKREAKAAGVDTKQW